MKTILKNIVWTLIAGLLPLAIFLSEALFRGAFNSFEKYYVVIYLSLAASYSICILFVETLSLLVNTNPPGKAATSIIMIAGGFLSFILIAVASNLDILPSRMLMSFAIMWICFFVSFLIRKKIANKKR